MSGTSYRLTDETKMVDGRTLYRIIALADNAFATSGDKGGWIEREDNLAHDGSWVGNESVVSGDARVDGGAAVLARATVCDQAVVSGRAVLWETCQIRGQARVEGGGLSCTIVAGEAVVDGAALVSDGAVVAGRAVVVDTAMVFGNARLGGDARVKGNAVVCNYATVAGSVEVCGTARLDGMRHRPRRGNEVISRTPDDEQPASREILDGLTSVRPSSVFTDRIAA